MSQPEGSGLDHGISPLLTNIAIGMASTMSNQYIAKQIFPNVPVAAPVGTYNVWDRGDFTRRQSKKLGNAEAPPVAGFNTSTRTYNVDHYGLSANYTAQDLARARVGGMTEQQFINGKVRLVTESNVIELECQTSAIVQTAGNWSSTVAGVSSGPTLGSTFLQWDQPGSDPVADVLYDKEVMRLAYGVEPNMMVIPYSVWLKLRSNQSLIDRIKYGGTMDRPTEVTLQQLKALFEIDNIQVPTSVYNTAAEGATASYSYIWAAKTVWLGFVAPAPSMDIPSAGYHFSWTGDSSFGLPAGLSSPGSMGPQDFGAALNPEGIFIRQYDTLRPAVRWVDGTLWTTPNVTAASMGMTLTAVIA